jgi:ribosomal protein S27E
MLRILRILLLGLLLTCPACRHGRMFRSLFVMNVRCPVCGVIFERDAGEVTGGMAINMTLTSTFALVAGGVLGIATDIPAGELIVLLGLATAGFGMLFYRHARGLWTSILDLTGSIFED